MSKPIRLIPILLALALASASVINVNASVETSARLAKSPTTVTVEDPNDPSRPGEKVEVYIHVTSPNGTPTGVVKITGADVNCQVTLESGMGSCQVVFKTLAKRTITANYLGDANFAPSSASAEHRMLRYKVFRSIGDLDGWLLESHEESEQGGIANSLLPTLIVGDDKADRQYRSILHFDTSAMPDDAIVSYAEVRVKRHSDAGQNPMLSQSLLLECKTDFFGQEETLAAHDFEAPANPVHTVNCSDFYSAGQGWFAAAFFPSVFEISLNGASQFRLHFGNGDNDDRSADFIRFYSGNAAWANRPQLIVWYSLP